jgi:hypothetical protein
MFQLADSGRSVRTDSNGMEELTMSQSIQKKGLWLLLGAGLAFVPQVAGLISVLRGILSNSNVELNVISVSGRILILLILLILVKDRYWKYGLVCGIVATVLMSAAKFASHTSDGMAAICAVASIASLAPAPFFLRKFWATEGIQVYGGMRANSPWQILVKVLIFIAIVFAMYFIGGLWGRP